MYVSLVIKIEPDLRFFVQLYLVCIDWLIQIFLYYFVPARIIHRTDVKRIFDEKPIVKAEIMFQLFI